MATFNFFGTVTPPNSATADNDVNLGLVWATLEAGTVTGIRFWQPSGHSGTRTVALYNADSGSLLASKVASSVADGWNTVSFDSAQSVSVGVTYVAVLHSTGSDYGYQNSYSWPAKANDDNLYTASTNAGRYDYSSSLARPTTVATNGTNFFVDLVFDDGAGGLETITGTGSPTLGALSSSSAGSPVVTGTSAATLAALSSSSTGAPVVTGTGSPTLAALSASSTATSTLTGTGASTLAALVSESSGSSGLETLTGTGASTLAALTSAGTGSPVVTGAATVTLADLLSSAVGTPIVVGTGASTLGVIVSAGTDSVTPDTLARTLALAGSSRSAIALAGRAGSSISLTGRVA